MCGHVSHGNRDTSERSLYMRHKCAETKGKANRRNPSVRTPEESDGNIVPKKSANKGAQPPAERIEERTPTKGNPQKRGSYRIQDRSCGQGSLERIRTRGGERETELYPPCHIDGTPGVVRGGNGNVPVLRGVSTDNRKRDRRASSTRGKSRMR